MTKDQLLKVLALYSENNPLVKSIVIGLEALPALGQDATPESVNKLRGQLHELENNPLPVLNIFAYSALLFLAEFKPLNDTDFLTIAPIPPENVVYISTGYQFDITSIFELTNQNLENLSNSINPYDRAQFSNKDIQHIKIFARLKNIVSTQNDPRSMTTTPNFDSRQFINVINAISARDFLNSNPLSLAIRSQDGNMFNAILSYAINRQDASTFNAMLAQLDPNTLQQLLSVQNPPASSPAFFQAHNQTGNSNQTTAPTSSRYIFNQPTNSTHLINAITHNNYRDINAIINNNRYIMNNSSDDNNTSYRPSV